MRAAAAFAWRRRRRIIDLCRPLARPLESRKQDMDLSEVSRLLDRKWDDDLLPRLVDYVKVPAKSPAFDPSWAARGELADVLASAHAWCLRQDIRDLKLEIVAIDGRTPCLYFEVPATGGLSNDAIRPVLWPPGQAAGNGGLARRPRPLPPGGREWPALRPRQCRRRLRHLYRAVGDPGARRAEDRQTPLRRA